MAPIGPAQQLVPARGDNNNNTCEAIPHLNGANWRAASLADCRARCVASRLVPGCPRSCLCNGTHGTTLKGKAGSLEDRPHLTNPRIARAPCGADNPNASATAARATGQHIKRIWSSRATGTQPQGQGAVPLCDQAVVLHMEKQVLAAHKAKIPLWFRRAAIASVSAPRMSVMPVASVGSWRRASAFARAHCTSIGEPGIRHNFHESGQACYIQLSLHLGVRPPDRRPGGRDAVWRMPASPTLAHRPNRSE